MDTDGPASHVYLSFSHNSLKKLINTQPEQKEATTCSHLDINVILKVQSVSFPLPIRIYLAAAIMWLLYFAG